MNKKTTASIPTRIQSRLNEFIIWPLKTAFNAKRSYYKARRVKGFRPVTILFYPEAPKTYHTLYKICGQLGWKITTNPNVHADLRIFFEDKTFRTPPPILKELSTSHKIINLNSTDISKKHVDEVFQKVFGYRMSLDPKSFKGTCVRKSDINAVHDGTLVTCPTEPEEGYVYQKYINTIEEDGRATDLRLNIFNDTIPVQIKRYKNPDDIFDITVDAQFIDADDALSKDEYAKVVEFCNAIGLDYGELDALRSKEDRKLYIVDVNNTPSGPIGPLYDNSADLHQWFFEISEATRREFLKWM